MKKFISILPAVILAALVMTGMDAEAAGTFNTIENGVFIGDIDVSGMTTLEAEDAVNSYVDGLKEKEITLNALNGNTVTVTAVNLTKILHQDLIGVLQHISFNSGFEVIYGIKDLLIKGRLEVNHVILNL